MASDEQDLRNSLREFGGYRHREFDYTASTDGKEYVIEPDAERKNKTRNENGGLG
eukprot:CAMPEP_0119523102 /NCGR_PEP_ID=MMETSP1344-20130328/38230_1 /TAXON_ID=236787 /ORGANISM="Florenciella parvula, Strain CCMP2471" /LENGTH=54 /DNA_ID=CAMNT_0007561237 /DNA_START=148 /DNA_END=307 /DNA_ORIENTATION=+